MKPEQVLLLVLLVVALRFPLATTRVVKLVAWLLLLAQALQRLVLMSRLRLVKHQLLLKSVARSNLPVV